MIRAIERFLIQGTASNISFKFSINLEPLPQSYYDKCQVFNSNMKQIRRYPISIEKDLSYFK
jgi:hypothetical protein